MNDKTIIGQIYLARVRQEGKSGCYISLGVTQENTFYAVDYENLRLRGDIAEIGENGATIIKEMNEAEIKRFQKYSMVKAEGIAKTIDCVTAKYFFDTYLKSRRSSENIEISKMENALQEMHNFEIEKSKQQGKESLLEFADFESLIANNRKTKKQAGEEIELES